MEDSEELERKIERITCRWCQTSGGIEEFRFDQGESGSDESPSERPGCH